jgi:hypothetical protein
MTRRCFVLILAWTIVFPSLALAQGRSGSDRPRLGGRLRARRNAGKDSTFVAPQSGTVPDGNSANKGPANLNPYTSDPGTRDSTTRRSPLRSLFHRFER